MDLAGEIEATLRNKRIPGLESEGFLMPYYEGLSLANIPATLAAILGVEVPEIAPPLPQEIWSDMATGIKRIVVVLLDATGYLALKRLMEAEPDIAYARLARKGRLVPLTSVFPSTTVTALTSLWTGHLPARHSLLGYTLYLKEFGVVANMIKLKPTRGEGLETLEGWGLELEKFLPVPCLAESLSSQDVSVYVLTHEQYVGSPLSKVLHRGVAKSWGFISASDMWVSVRRMLQQYRDKRMLISVYWAGVDSISHLYGPSDDAWEAELCNLAFSMEREFLAKLTPEEREGTLLIIISDHGQVPTPPEKAIWAIKHPQLWDSLVVPPTGEARISYLYVRDGRKQQVRDYLEKELGQFAVLESEEALEIGLFGKGEVAPETPQRIGDLIAFARGDAHLIWGYKEPKLRGRHGGLTPEEMLVPLLMVRLDDIKNI
ncbi:MAG: hypothetical protein DRI61_01580 [Chloroflexi bacterium]|nr:MAG: hypothetical protein DRI61_01580 [Chloroflexota bacterium]HDN79567.1 alkaline phosphatase family protein [Chloroflexota bacterium]